MAEFPLTSPHSESCIPSGYNGPLAHYTVIGSHAVLVCPYRCPAVLHYHEADESGCGCGDSSPHCVQMSSLADEPGYYLMPVMVRAMRDQIDMIAKRMPDGGWRRIPKDILQRRDYFLSVQGTEHKIRQPYGSWEVHRWNELARPRGAVPQLWTDPTYFDVKVLADIAPATG